ncbi:unnamed protein product [Lepeophtheirus salmonis]|uniref:(salmon louse) hypothetical protein n=1 Tax=Lepeophtheirus salmonis TaxID=72036 RepID=A0A7R8H080_LEPSM|nr:unnamed protein product [Lepeophtheirus salmonis]CAF2764173.1 unnamed protein product [Lepeophtheirus salmonis]
MWKFLLLVGFFVISIDSQMTKVTTGPMVKTTLQKCAAIFFHVFVKQYIVAGAIELKKYCPKTCGRCRPVTKKPCNNRWGYWCQYYRNYCNYYKVRKNCRKTCRRCH